MAREGPGLEGAGEAEPGTLWVQSWEPGPGRTWPVIWEERFSFMEEMSLVLLSLRLGLCAGRECVSEVSWAAPQAAPDLTAT